MENKKAKWLIYTVLVGLIPILSRFLVWGVTESGVVSLITASDFIAFGLILHISNINEIEHLSDDEKSWKTIQNGTSIVFIAFYSVLFALIMVSEGVPSIIDANVIKTCTISLAFISLAISFSVFHRISKITITERLT
jgi:CRISPR/Cas system CMR-associated protein Cmr3 (group 5 of RAMP superfamily)